MEEVGGNRKVAIASLPYLEHSTLCSPEQAATSERAPKGAAATRQQRTGNIRAAE